MVTDRDYLIAQMENDCYDNRIIDAGLDLVYNVGRFKGIIRNKFQKVIRAKRNCECCEAIGKTIPAVYFIQIDFKQRDYYCQKCAEKVAKKIGKPLEELVDMEE